MRDRFPWLLAAAYTAIFTVLGAVRYAVHRNLVDFGIFAQTIASAFGCFCNAIEGSHWAFHFSPILYVPAAVVALWRSPLALIVFTALPCALAIPPLYAVAARHANRDTARLVAIVAFLYPPLAGLAFNDFHENVFAPAAIAWALWAFDSGYLGIAVGAAIVAIATKEDQAIFVGVAGAIAALVYRGTKRGITGIVVAALGFGAALAFFLIIQPHAQANPSWAPVRFYAWTGADVRALFPNELLARIGFLALVFAPLGFLPFRSRLLWLALAPFAEVLLSRMSTTYTNGTHYAGAWIGYVLIAFALAACALPEARRRAVLWVCIALCVLELVVANPMHPGLNLRVVQRRDVALDAQLHRLPRDISIATQEEAYTHLALHDPFARLLPDDPSAPLRACFVLVDHAFPQSPRLQEYGGAFAGLLRAKTYSPVSIVGSVEIYRRSHSCR